MVIATKFVVRLGKRLYVSSKMYGMYQSTTTDIMQAYFFSTYQDAERVAKKAIGAEIIEIYISDAQDDRAEIDMMRASIIQLQKERDEALEIIELIKDK